MLGDLAVMAFFFGWGYWYRGTKIPAQDSTSIPPPK